MTNPAGGTTSYDESPYESLPLFYTRPEYLSAIGILFGMTPPELETARVLELGAAAGGSLLTFAARYPRSKSLGIDLSKAQIEQGQAQVQALGLKNLELKAMSLLEVDGSYGLFDYIICHGVYSWVPDSVRTKILEIAAKNLVPNGIVFISYNTLPGWNQLATLRDLLRFHAAQFEDLHEKVDQAKAFLGFVCSALEESDDPHSKFLKQEAESLVGQPESYLLHEYLIGENQPFYFRDFMRDAAAEGLAYLGEAHLATMGSGDLPESASAKLAEMDDLLKKEQCQDFIHNRRFRCTLLCHEQAQLNRNVNASVMEKLFFSMNVTSETDLAQIDCCDDAQTLEFSISGGKELIITAGNRLMKAVMVAFVESNGREVTVEEIRQNVLSKCPELESDQLGGELDTLFLAMLYEEAVRPVAAPSGALKTISEQPKVSELVRLQVLNPNASWVSNQVNESIAIGDFERLAMRYLDGERTREEIVSILLRDHVETGELEVNFGGATVADPILILQGVRDLLDSLLEKIRTQFLLIA